MALIVNTYCPKCAAKCVTNDTLIEGKIAVWCQACDEFWLQGDYKTFKGDSTQIKAQLKGRLEDMKREQQMLDSEINDPRWTRIN